MFKESDQEPVNIAFLENPKRRGLMPRSVICDDLLIAAESVSSDLLAEGGVGLGVIRAGPCGVGLILDQAVEFGLEKPSGEGVILVLAPLGSALSTETSRRVDIPDAGLCLVDVLAALASAMEGLAACVAFS